MEFDKSRLFWKFLPNFRFVSGLNPSCKSHDCQMDMFNPIFIIKPFYHRGVN